MRAPSVVVAPPRHLQALGTENERRLWPGALLCLASAHTTETDSRTELGAKAAAEAVPAQAQEPLLQPGSARRAGPARVSLGPGGEHVGLLGPSRGAPRISVREAAEAGVGLSQL